MSHATQISRLGNELTLFTTSISLGDEPHHWLENNASQILTISSIDRKDYGEIKLIYPRLYVYTREIVKSSNAKLVNALTRLYLGWTTNVDEVTQLVNYHTINGTLRTYLSRCKTKHRQNTGPSSQETSHSRTVLSRASTLPNRKSIIEWEENILDRILKLDAQCVAAHLLVLLKDPERRSLLLSVKDQAAQSLLDLFQELLGLLHLRGIRSYLVSALLELSRNSGLYPEELLLRNVNTRGLHPVCGGTFGNICKGILGGHAVAIKVMRAFQDVNKCIKAFSKEAILWGQLSNPYVLPFCGVYRLPDNPSQLCLVSPWMVNGNLSQYLGQKPQANRLSLLLDVALGLEYLHSFDPQVIHGDLKGANILITPDERACLADFGLSTIAQEANIAQSILTNSSLSPGSIPWMAPELLSYTETDRKYKSGATDMYSFGCVCYEVYAGRPRFSEFTLPQAIMALAHNQRPARPQNLDLDDATWGLIERCWDAGSKSRPKASEAVCQLQSHPGVPKRGELVDQVNDFASRLLASLANAPLATPVIPEETVALSYFSSQQQLNFRPLKAFTPGGMERVPSTTPSLGNSIISSVYSDELATITENDIVIALMGPTGTGKSSFINTARRRSSAPVGESLESCTQSVRAYSCLHPDGSGRNVVFVDTPGFDDSHRTDYAILKDIAKWMEETYRHRIKLTGILYLHNIAESRMRGAPMRNKDMFEELCGAGALQNVVLTTTMWADVAKDVGVRREIQLQTQFWGAAMACGCRSTRFSYTFQSAWEIVGMFDDVVPQALQLQTQIVDEKRPLHETSAYAVLVRWWTQMTRKFRDLVRRRVGSPQDREIMQNTLLFAEKQAKALENLGSSGKTFATFLSPKARNSRN